VSQTFLCQKNPAHESLFATEAGWVCLDCDYTQNWAHSYMAINTEQVRNEDSDMRHLWNTRLEHSNK